MDAQKRAPSRDSARQRTRRRGSLPRAPRKGVNLHHDFGLRLLKMANVVLVTLPFALVWWLYYVYEVLMFPSSIRATGIVVMFVVLYAFFGRAYEAFLISLKHVSDMFYSQVLSILFSDAFMFLVMWLMSDHFPDLAPALGTLVVQLVLSSLWCLGSNRWYYANYARQKTGVVYDMRRGVEDLFGRYGMTQKFDVQFTCTVEDCLSDLRRLDDLTSVFLCGIHSKERNIILKYCVANGIVVYIIPRVGDVIMSGAKKIHMFHLPIMRVDRYNPPPEYNIAKRTMDVVLSLGLLAVSSPFMLIAAICIKLEDGGHVFYKQTRLTKDGREFTMLKFRSMVESAENDGVARLSCGSEDKRVTKVGRMIRACRIDELPQLFNVLGGSMSLVGPRPERPEIAAEYERQIPEFALRLQARAGITGYAQVYGKYNTNPYDKLQLDLMYISRPSIIEDIKILFATLMILFKPESTEGIAPGRVNAGSDDQPAA